MNVRNPHPSGGAGTPPMTMSGLRRSFSLLKNYRGVAFLAYFSLFISTAAMLMVPQITQNIIDAVTHGLVAQKIAALPAAFQSMALQQLGWTAEQFARYRDGGVNAVLWSGVLIVLFAIARGLFAFSQGYNAERVSQGIAFDLRNRLFEKIQRLSFSYHDRNQTGQLMVRATDDVDKVRLFLGQGLLIALQSVVLLVAALIILSATNYRLMLTILPILPVAMAVFFVFSRIAQPLFLGVQQRLSRLNTILQENLAGIKVIKAFVQEPVQKKRFNQAAEDLMNQQIKVSRTFSFLFPFVFLIANLGQALIQYAGGRQIIEGTLSIGEWQKFSMYLFYVFFPLGQLGFVINQLAQASASANRIYEILDAESEVKNKPDALELPPIQGRVEFRNVTFKYFGSSEPALDDVSFVAEPGQTIALLGATGSGKSTIINLIPRFYDVSAGSVLIDGYDVRDVTIESLRRQIGIVLQDTTLFTGTIRENIAFGKPEATQEEIEAAAKAALAHDFIMSFPDGYDTRVGERGTTLSGGQKQRIAIARALLLDPRILILDDSTSSVDTVTEYQIQQALNRLMKGRTSFVIAQRISTVRNADQILVLDRGRIVARGRHEDLLEESPIYAEIYHSQLIEDVPAVAALTGASAAE
ncbi:ABC transporter ATP-binding protein [Anaerolinea thermophila]|uniref:ABC transporter ATP-binding protein n=1 Tax=Anaerolinea thermophila TaxID=167964 RepID=UPI0026F2D6EB|nr:ABC transporter ATP-binding protein [Anaerolinea thermophila]